MQYIDGVFLDNGHSDCAGRGFTSDDKSDSPLVAIVNETFALRFLPGQKSYRQAIREQRRGALISVVGIAKTANISI